MTQEDKMVISITAYGNTHTVECTDDATASELFRHYVSLAKSVGYMLGSIDEAIVEVGAEVAEELELGMKEKSATPPTATTFDFGEGPVPAHRHVNPDGSEGGWVAETATVEATAYVGPDARVFGNTWVSGNAWVYENARVFDNAWVFGNARMYENARVFGDAWVYGNARVYGDARVYGYARLFGDVWLGENARVFGDARVSGNARV
jgi:hypothetical protein